MTDLKADQRIEPLRQGIDFLGYVIYPTHTLVRRRVVAHAREALAAWEGSHVQVGRITATPVDLRRLQSVVASYDGHFVHANSHRLARGLRRRFPWITTAATRRRFHWRAEDRQLCIRLPGVARS